MTRFGRQPSPGDRRRKSQTTTWATKGGCPQYRESKANGADEAPLLHLRRDADDGLFERFTEHYDSIWTNASTPIHPDGENYPDPAERPDRYEPSRVDGAESQHGAGSTS